MRRFICEGSKAIAYGRSPLFSSSPGLSRGPREAQIQALCAAGTIPALYDSPLARILGRDPMTASRKMDARVTLLSLIALLPGPNIGQIVERHVNTTRMGPHIMRIGVRSDQDRSSTESRISRDSPLNQIDRPPYHVG